LYCHTFNNPPHKYLQLPSLRRLTDFASVSNEADFNAAACGTAKIIYNSSNGSIFYNAKVAEAGLGKGSQFATAQGAPALTVNDFQVQW
jgi:hypothetical protein